MWELFVVFLQIGLVGFGGGYAILSLIASFCVDKSAWLSNSEFIDMVTMSELIPGPILINAATFIGSKVAGFWGALVATLASVLPSIFIVMILTVLYFRYKELTLVQNLVKFLKPLIIALILSACASILLPVVFREQAGDFPGNIDWLVCGMIVVSFILLRKYRANPLLIILGGGALSSGLYLLGKLL